MENPKSQILNPKSRPGFTLIELILYVGLSSLLLFVISVFLAMLLQARIKNQTIAEVDQQGLQVMQLITQAIRNAEAVTIPAVGASSTSLTLDVVPVANDPTVFDLAGDVLQITEGTGAPVALTNNRVIVSGLSFRNASEPETPGTVRVQFTITHRNEGGRFEFAYQSVFAGSATLRQP